MSGKLEVSAQLSYLHAISDLIDFRKAHEASADKLRTLEFLKFILRGERSF